MYTDEDDKKKKKNLWPSFWTGLTCCSRFCATTGLQITFTVT